MFFCKFEFLRKRGWKKFFSTNVVMILKWKIDNGQILKMGKFSKFDQIWFMTENCYSGWMEQTQIRFLSTCPLLFLDPPNTKIINGDFVCLCWYHHPGKQFHSKFVAASTAEPKLSNVIRNMQTRKDLFIALEEIGWMQNP